MAAVLAAVFFDVFHFHYARMYLAAWRVRLQAHPKFKMVKDIATSSVFRTSSNFCQGALAARLVPASHSPMASWWWAAFASRS